MGDVSEVESGGEVGEGRDDGWGGVGVVSNGRGGAGSAGM